METKLLRKDYILILVCILVAIISTIIVSNNFTKAFPEASINFKVTKNQSKEIASQFLDQIGFDKTGYRHSAIFSYDGEAKVFLEKELGAEKANELMGTKVRLWRWSNRWYKPMQKEEINVRVSPEGQLLGYTHLIPEEQEGAFLSADSAKQIVLEYLKTETQLNTAELEFVEQSQKERPNRLDHTFIWKKADFKINEADYRYSLTILGDKIGGKQEYLFVPDSWSRDYEKLRSKNNTTGLLAGFLLVLTVLAMLVVLIQRTRNLDIKWRTALIFGSIAAVLSFLSYINNIPVSLYNYPTTDPFSSFLLKSIALDLVYALLTGFGIFFVTAAAEPLYREKYKNHISLTKTFSWHGLRTKKFFIAVIVGITLTFFFAAYQVIFYLVTKKFGGWAPQDIPYDNLLNTAFPWISVLLIGFLPAVSEEFISRMFSIPFFHRIVKYRWLAVIIPAFIWGFGHASYPQQPFYIRGLEVGLAGIFIGFVMLRFGILATLVWHYTVDALYTALLLLRSNNSYFITTAAIGTGIMLLPLIIALIAYIKNRSFVSDVELLNDKEAAEEDTSPEPILEEIDKPTYNPLSQKRLFIGLGIAAILALFAFLKVEKIGDFVKFPSSKEQAKVAAKEFLQSQNYNVSDHKSVVYSSQRFSRMDTKYILENADIRRVNKLYSQESKGARWGVRFYKPLQKEEFSVYVDPRDLSIVSFARTIDEDAIGANLPKDSALVLAEDFALTQNINVKELDLKDASANKRDNRTDFSFVWEAREGDEKNIAELKYRVTVDIQGDQVSTFSTNIKLPEIWERERDKQTIFQTILLIMKILLIGFFFVFAIIRFVKEAKLGHILWKKPLLVAGAIALINLAVHFLNFNITKRVYVTSIEPQLFNITIIISLLLSSILLFVFITLALSFLSALYPNVLNTLSKVYRKSLGRDTLLILLINMFGMIGINKIVAILQSRFSVHLLGSSLSLPEHIDSKLPALSAIDGGLTASLLTATLLGVLIFMFKDYIKKPIFLLPLALVTLIAFLPSNVFTLGEALLAGSRMLLLGLWSLGMVVFFMRNNWLTYILIPFTTLVMLNISELFKQQNPFFTSNGLGLVCILLLVVLWILLPSFKKNGSI